MTKVLPARAPVSVRRLDPAAELDVEVGLAATRAAPPYLERP